MYRHVHDTRSRSNSKEKENEWGKWDLAFDSRRRSAAPPARPPSRASMNRSVPPCPAPPRPRRAPIARGFALPRSLYYDRTRRFHFMIVGVGAISLALCTIPDCSFTGLQLLYSYSLSVVPLRASVCHVFSKYFLASPFRSDRGVSPPSARKIRGVRRSVAVTVAASLAPPPPLPC